MIPHPAQYLLRFDDLCPTMDRSRWRAYCALIEQYSIQPILAVVPANRDPDLALSDPNPRFWEEMRAMQNAGAIIGLHGYTHLCASVGRSLWPTRRATEFAGVPAETQRRWICAGLGILHDRGLDPRIWVAPRHGFDRNTLWALRKGGVRLLSDGFTRIPILRDGVVWIPQQLWAPQEKVCGLWTICIHSNTAPDSLFAQLAEFLAARSHQFTSVDRVLREYPARRPGFAECLYETVASARLHFRSVRNAHRAGK